MYELLKDNFLIYFLINNLFIFIPLYRVFNQFFFQIPEQFGVIHDGKFFCEGLMPFHRNKFDK